MPSSLSDIQSNAHGCKPHGYPLYHRTLVGRWVDFAIDETIDGAFLFSWELDINPHLTNGFSILVFENGTFLQRIAGTEGTFEWVYTPNETENAEEIERWNFDFILAPNSRKYDSFPWVRELNLQNKIKLNWKVPDGPISKVSIYKNPPNSLDVDTDHAIRDFHRPILEIDSSNVTLSGDWQGQEENSEIECTIGVSGRPGIAILEWTYKDDSGSLTLQTYPQELFNGVRLAFTDRVWTEGESFSVFVRFPSQWISGKVGNGSHVFQVATWNQNNHRILSDEMPSISVVKVPPAPRHVLTDYQGDGNASIYWQLPSDPDLKFVRVYRNFPTANVKTIHRQPIFKSDCSPGQLFSFDVADLEPGLNRLICRVQNSIEREENLNYVEILLDSNLEEYTVPNPPISIDAKVEEDGTLTLTIVADRTSDTINVYHDSKTGTVNYSSLFASVVNPQLGDRQTITLPGLYLADGQYLLAARSKSGSVEEENTDVLTELIINTETSPMPYDLELELVD